jgi:hypothetical protein
MNRQYLSTQLFVVIASITKGDDLTMDRNAFIVSGCIGLILQLAMIVAGHYVPVIKDKGFMIGGLVLSLIAGLVYAKLAHAGWPSSLIGAALSGGLCAIIAIAASVMMGDTPPVILLMGTLSSAVTGLIGGAIGKLIG